MADGTIILQRDRVNPHWTNVTADLETVEFDYETWRNTHLPLTTVTETDVALSLVDGSARNFRREISVGETEEATVELEWHGQWHEYRRIGNNEWRRTRRIE